MFSNFKQNRRTIVEKSMFSISNFYVRTKTREETMKNK